MQEVSGPLATLSPNWKKGMIGKNCLYQLVFLPFDFYNIFRLVVPKSSPKCEEVGKEG